MHSSRSIFRALLCISTWSTKWTAKSSEACLILEHHLTAVEAACSKCQCTPCKCTKPTSLEANWLSTTWSLQVRVKILEVIKEATKAQTARKRRGVETNLTAKSIKICSDRTSLTRISSSWCNRCKTSSWTSQATGQKTTQAKQARWFQTSTKSIVTLTKWRLVRPRARISWMVWTTNSSRCQCWDPCNKTCPICQM